MALHLQLCVAADDGEEAREGEEEGDAPCASSYTYTLPSALPTAALRPSRERSHASLLSPRRGDDEEAEEVPLVEEREGSLPTRVRRRGTCEEERGGRGGGGEGEARVERGRRRRGTCTSGKMRERGEPLRERERDAPRYRR